MSALGQGIVQRLQEELMSALGQGVVQRLQEELRLLGLKLREQHKVKGLPCSELMLRTESSSQLPAHMAARPIQSWK